MPPVTPVRITSSLISPCDAISIIPHLSLISVIAARFSLYLTPLVSCPIALSNVTPGQVPIIQTVTPTSHAESALSALQNWYDTSSGLYNTTGWWNSANCLTTIAKLALLDPQIKSLARDTLSNSFIQAPQNNLYIKKSLSPDTFLIHTEHTIHSTPNYPLITTDSGFLNDYYDDEGWWALAWINSYDLTLEPHYLSTAITIFSDMRLGATTPCGGIWWDKHQTYVNAIANSLYLSVAAHLARRAPSEAQRSEFLRLAEEQWMWFKKSGMINGKGTVNDGLRRDCRSNNGTVWSYNQGVIISALAELHLASSSNGVSASLQETDAGYLDTASRIAYAAIDRLSDENGILHDVCEPACGADGNQFKGVLMRGLMDFLTVGNGDRKIEAFVNVNMESIWECDRGEGDVLGLVWSGPLRNVDAATQSSALDALVAGVSLTI